jgi:hypothetical protein
VKKESDRGMPQLPMVCRTIVKRLYVCQRYYYETRYYNHQQQLPRTPTTTTTIDYNDSTTIQTMQQRYDNQPRTGLEAKLMLLV